MSSSWQKAKHTGWILANFYFWMFVNHTLLVIFNLKPIKIIFTLDWSFFTLYKVILHVHLLKNYTEPLILLHFFIMLQKSQKYYHS